MLAPLPTVASTDLIVPLATGGTARYVNLDNAASTSALTPVVEAVNAALPWYSSVHRGAGFASQVSTRLYEAARQQIADFVGARDTDTVLVLRNTTEAINTIAHILPIPDGASVITTAVEHHANLLPWRRVAPVVHLDIPASPDALIDSLRAALEAARPGSIVAITGASNVTGEVFPVRRIADVVHEYGALLCVDAAQLAPHRAIDMAAMGIDCLALSGHKMYAPFGSGVAVVPRAIAAAATPFLAGGGAVDLVTLDDVVWTEPPDRHEAGSPNVLGAIALGAAAMTLGSVGMQRIRAHEQELVDRVATGVTGIRGLRRLTLWPGADVDRVGVFTFVMDCMPHALVAAALSAEWGVGVRHGCFCAHPYLTHLLDVPQAETEELRRLLRDGNHPAMPGAVRASFGIGTRVEDVDRLVEGLATLCADGPKLEYMRDDHTGDYTVVNDTRAWPRLAGLPDISTMDGSAAGCGRF